MNSSHDNEPCEIVEVSSKTFISSSHLLGALTFAEYAAKNVVQQKHVRHDERRRFARIRSFLALRSIAIETCRLRGQSEAFALGEHRRLRGGARSANCEPIYDTKSFGK